MLHYTPNPKLLSLCSTRLFILSLWLSLPPCAAPAIFRSVLLRLKLNCVMILRYETVLTCFLIIWRQHLSLHCSCFLSSDNNWITLLSQGIKHCFLMSTTKGSYYFEITKLCFVLFCFGGGGWFQRSSCFTPPMLFKSLQIGLAWWKQRCQCRRPE